MLFARKAVHCALLLAVVMISLAVLYAVQDAPFLFAVQIIVYTGAILMLFLFVLMLVGVDASDSVVETIRGQRLLAAVVGLVFGATLVIGVAQVSVGAVTGLGAANAGGNVPGHRQGPVHQLRLRLRGHLGAADHRGARRDGARAPRAADPEALARPTSPPGGCGDYAETGRHLGPLPPPGVFARHNAVDTPALLPDGTPVVRVDLARPRRPRVGQPDPGQRHPGRALRLDETVEPRTTRTAGR